MPRRSKVDALPPELKAELERYLLDRSHDGYEALAAWLAERGHPVGKSSVHRFDQRLQRVMGQIKATAEAARVLAAAHPDQADEHSAAVIRLVQSALFEAMLKVREAEEADPTEQVKLLAAAARAIAEASRASIGQKRWAEEVRSRIDETVRQAQKDGKPCDMATVELIRRAIGLKYEA